MGVWYAYVYTCLHACAQTFVYRRMYTSVRVHVDIKVDIRRYSPQPLFALVTEVGSLGKTTVWQFWLVQLASIPTLCLSLFPPEFWDSRWLPCPTSFYTGSKNPNSGLHICIANFIAERHPQPWKPFSPPSHNYSPSKSFQRWRNSTKNFGLKSPPGSLFWIGPPCHTKWLPLSSSLWGIKKQWQCVSMEWMALHLQGGEMLLYKFHYTIRQTMLLCSQNCGVNFEEKKYIPLPKLIPNRASSGRVPASAQDIEIEEATDKGPLSLQCPRLSGWRSSEGVTSIKPNCSATSMTAWSSHSICSFLSEYKMMNYRGQWHLIAAF